VDFEEIKRNRDQIQSYGTKREETSKGVGTGPAEEFSVFLKVYLSNS